MTEVAPAQKLREIAQFVSRGRVGKALAAIEALAPTLATAPVGGAPEAAQELLRNFDLDGRKFAIYVGKRSPFDGGVSFEMADTDGMMSLWFDEIEGHPVAAALAAFLESPPE